MGDDIRIHYLPREDATPENEARILAHVYRFLLDRHAKTKGGSTTTPDSRNTDSQETTLLSNHDGNPGLSTVHIGPQEEMPTRNEPNNPQ